MSPEFLFLDVDSEESIQAAREEVQRKYGRLDVLINNAGMLFRVRNTCTLCTRPGNEGTNHLLYQNLRSNI